jgi:hypothetical protein
MRGPHPYQYHGSINVIDHVSDAEWRASAHQAEGFLGIHVNIIEFQELLRVLLVKRTAYSGKIEPSDCHHPYSDHLRSENLQAGSPIDQFLCQ